MTEFSEALEEMGTCLLEKTALNDDEESGMWLCTVWLFCQFQFVQVLYQFDWGLLQFFRQGFNANWKSTVRATGNRRYLCELLLSFFSVHRSDPIPFDQNVPFSISFLTCNSVQCFNWISELKLRMTWYLNRKFWGASTLPIWCPPVCPHYNLFAIIEVLM